MKKDNIILVGMPTSGKSTVGVILAKILGYNFVDADIVIQKKEGRYYLVNLTLKNLLSPDGSTVPAGYATELYPGAAFRLLRDDDSLLMKVELFNIN